jgi:acetylxylan esterase
MRLTNFGIQASQIMADAICSSGDTAEGITSTAATISSTVGAKVKAMIWMGDPAARLRQHNVGSSNTDGVSIRVSSYARSSDPG